MAALFWVCSVIAGIIGVALLLSGLADFGNIIRPIVALVFFLPLAAVFALLAKGAEKLSAAKARP